MGTALLAAVADRPACYSGRHLLLGRELFIVWFSLLCVWTFFACGFIKVSLLRAQQTLEAVS